MNKQTKKRSIALLLLGCCIISAWLLFITPERDTRQLQNFAQADSLIQLTLSDFNISDAQISSYSTKIDSTFSRKTYTISIPPAFSKTQFHAALQQQLSPYHIELPARVTFPERDMSVHLYVGKTVFRTIKLVTDQELEMQQSFAHIIVAFQGKPPAYLLDKLTSFGEPIPVAIILTTPLQLPAWWDEISAKYADLYIWAQTPDGKNLLNDEQNQLIQVLEPLKEASKKPVLLHFFEDLQTASSLLGQTSFAYINARDAFILNAEVGETAFNQSFRSFVSRSRNGSIPLALVIGTEESLTWTRKELSTFEKGGLMLTKPQPKTF